MPWKVGQLERLSAARPPRSRDTAPALLPSEKQSGETKGNPPLRAAK